MDSQERNKGRICAAWLRTLRRSMHLTLSVQVLNESYAVAWRKPRFEPARPRLRPYLTAYSLWCTSPLDPDVTLAAWTLQDRYGVQFWDALLLASANKAGCRWFLSEDLNDGQLYGDVRALNPFRHAPQDVLGPRATS
ncbi:PIN domain-containing protein [Brevundimonas sp.]|uniref:PIN domain-containing protein n=1 Tax=Brevundimonas sp. TaxID=1871086 RepID=UPI00391C8D3D